MPHLAMPQQVILIIPMVAMPEDDIILEDFMVDEIVIREEAGSLEGSERAFLQL